jgi:hypothetical protein
VNLDSATPPNPDTLIDYGRDEIVQRLSEAARKEATNGDGRALRVLQRLLTVCGYERRKGHCDDGN